MLKDGLLQRIEHQADTQPVFTAPERGRRRLFRRRQAGCGDTPGSISVDILKKIKTTQISPVFTHFIPDLAVPLHTNNMRPALR